MASNKEHAEFIADMLSELGSIEIGNLFGGRTLKLSDRQVGFVCYETFYFTVIDPEMQKRFEQEGSEQFSYTRKDKKDPVIIKNWWTVPEKYLDNPQELCSLARELMI